MTGNVRKRLVPLLFCCVLGVSLLPKEASAMRALWRPSAAATYPIITMFHTWLTGLAKEKSAETAVEARNLTLKTEMNRDLTGYLLSSIVSPSNTFSIETNGEKGKARVLDAHTGRFLYQPFADRVGTDHFTFVIEDQFGNKDVGEVTVIITKPNHAPVAESFAVGTAKDKPVTDTLKGRDPDGDALTYRIVVSPELGTVTIDDPKTGAFTYRPHPGTTGKDRFKFEVDDAKVSSNWGTVTVTITE